MVTPNFPIPAFYNMSILTFSDPRGGVFEKFDPDEYPHFAIYQKLIHCEIVVDDKNWSALMPDYSGHDESARFTTIRLAIETFIWLLKLRGFHHFHTPIMLEGSSVRDLRSAEDGSVRIHSLYHRPMSVPMSSMFAAFGSDSITPEDLEWTLENHLTLYNLFYESKNFQAVANALRNLSTDVEVETKMGILWAAIEHIVKPGRDSIRQSISKRAAMLLHGRGAHPGMDPEMIYKEVRAFYDYRCDVVHGIRPLIGDWNSISRGNVSEEDRRSIDVMQGTFNVFRLLFIGIIERGSFYEKEELEILQKRYDDEYS